MSDKALELAREIHRNYCAATWHNRTACVDDIDRDAALLRPHVQESPMSYLLTKCKCGHAMAAHDFSSPNPFLGKAVRKVAPKGTPIYHGVKPSGKLPRIKVRSKKAREGKKQSS